MNLRVRLFGKGVSVLSDKKWSKDTEEWKREITQNRGLTMTSSLASYHLGVVQWCELLLTKLKDKQRHGCIYSLALNQNLTGNLSINLCITVCVV